MIPLSRLIIYVFILWFCYMAYLVKFRELFEKKHYGNFFSLLQQKSL